MTLLSSPRVRVPDDVAVALRPSLRSAQSALTPDPVRRVSVLPLSAAVEVIGTRDTLRRILAYLYHPFLVVRLGIMDPSVSGPPPAPRLPADQIIDRL